MADSVVRQALGDAPEVFVGRLAQRRALDRFLSDDSFQRIAYVHGIAGIGKSALLRNLGRSAIAGGYGLLRLDGRELIGDTAVLDQALEPLADVPRPLLIIDAFEGISSLGAHLRERVLPTLGPGARVAIASRFPPDPLWRESEWGHSMLQLSLDELGDADAAELLISLGVDDADLRTVLIDWAAGLPLALSLAAAGGVAGPDLDDLDGALLDHLAGAELLGADRDVLAVAAVAPAVDARLLSAVLSRTDGAEAEAWLRNLSFSEGLGRRVTLHARVRHLLDAELRRHEPEYERELRLRIMDHLCERALDAEPHLIADMRDLLEAPEDQGASYVEAGDTYRVDRVRASDGDEIERGLQLQVDDDVHQAWWRRWIADAPEHVLAIRGKEQIAALGIWATPRRAPAWASEDPVLSRWLGHAARFASDGRVIFLLGMLFFCDPGDVPEAIAMGNLALTVRSGIPNVRLFYSTVLADDQDTLERSGAYGAEVVSGLDIQLGADRLVTTIIDFGPGGLIETTRARAHLAYGSVPDGASYLSGEVTVQLARETLRAFHQPLVLADSPLAVGIDRSDRAESVRSVVREAVERSFGPSAEEQLMRAVLEIGYLDPQGGGHLRAMRDLHISRRTYFRRLGEATARVAQNLHVASA
ncbi:MAG: hypothetical protein QOJ72_768 [Nocardioidaceae bacterium]|nr:hypothetical protein [Nocardioidaceae bacterium]